MEHIKREGQTTFHLTAPAQKTNRASEQLTDGRGCKEVLRHYHVSCVTQVTVSRSILGAIESTINLRRSQGRLPFTVH
jgi:hypothetical protein